MPDSNPNPPVSLSTGQHAIRRAAVAYYDFATDGGAVGALVLRGDTLPLNAYVTSYKLIVDTVVTSGGAATIALSYTAAGDIQVAGTLAANGYAATGPKANAASVAVGSATKLTATVAVAALTAGSFRVVTEYITFA